MIHFTQREFIWISQDCDFLQSFILGAEILSSDWYGKVVRDEVHDLHEFHSITHTTLARILQQHNFHYNLDHFLVLYFSCDESLQSPISELNLYTPDAKLMTISKIFTSPNNTRAGCSDWSVNCEVRYSLNQRKDVIKACSRHQLLHATLWQWIARGR